MKKLFKVLVSFLVAFSFIATTIVQQVQAITSDVDNVQLATDDMKWEYLDRDLQVQVRDSKIYENPADNGKPTGEIVTSGDPNAYTWYSRWNKKNGWTYPDSFKDWGLFNMDFSHAEWSKNYDDQGVVSGTSFTSNQSKMPADITFAKNGNDVRPTYFLRYTFHLDDPKDIYAIVGEVTYKDAMIFYINGKPVSNLFNIPMSNYKQNLEYGSNEARSTMKTEQFILEDTTSLMAGDNVIAIELHASDAASDVYFKLNSFILNPDENNLPEVDAVKSIALNVGANDTDMNFAWYSLSNKVGNIQIMEGNSVSDFNASKATTIQANNPVEAYTMFKATTYYSNKAVFTGVTPGKNYVYRVGNEDAYSPVYVLHTSDTSKKTEFIFVSDPQIGTGTIPTDLHGWQQTLKASLTRYPNSSFIANTGDFVDVANKEGEYDAYFTPELLKSYPTATAVGNHDIAINYKNHFNEPNASDYGVTVANSDYYFIKGNTLYMVLNTSSDKNDEHIAFMNEVVEKTKSEDIKWRVVLFHQSIYSGGKQATLDDALKRRAALVPAFDALGIDLALSGHDHGYVRTYQMKDLKPVENSALNPLGTVYLTASSASGSKYYGSANLPEIDAYSAKSLFNVPTYTHISIDDTTLTINTYQMHADGSDTLYDTYTITKNLDTSAIDNVIDTMSKTNYSKYSVASYQAMLAIKKQVNDAIKTATRQEAVDAQLEILKKASDVLVKDQMNPKNVVTSKDNISVIGTHDQVQLTTNVTNDFKQEADYKRLSGSTHVKDYTVQTLYDISLSRNDSEYQPDGKVLVRIPQPTALKTREVKIAHVHGQSIDIIEPTVKDGYYEFSIDSFSSFYLLVKNEVAPDTGDTTNTSAYLVLLVLAGGVLLVSKKLKA